jgi:hypothetical protein
MSMRASAELRTGAVPEGSKLQAPTKQFIWFEHSGHVPYDFESTRLNTVIVDKVLAETVAQQ